MLRVLLAGAELELAPSEVAGHPAIRKQAEAIGKRPGQLLLDQNLHGAAMGRLEDGKRRGRPDLVHLSLLTLMESPLAKAGGLDVAIHTRHDELIRMRPDTRLPRGEARFQGLMAKVLGEGKSQDRDPLLWVEGRMPPSEVARKLACGPVVRLDESGARATPAQVVERAVAGPRGRDLTLVLGAFPSGDFPAGWREACPEAVSIWPDALNVWACSAELVAAFRARWGPDFGGAAGAAGAASGPAAAQQPAAAPASRKP